MSPSLKFALQRISADFEPLGFPPISLGQTEHGLAVIWSLPGAMITCLVDETAQAEPVTAYMVGYLQDYVIYERWGAWPEVGGRPLWPSADSGVACWCVDGKPWCAVGQLTGALAAAAPDPAE